MRLLLDTNVFIGAVSKPRLLSKAASKALADPRNERVLSDASIWEIITKTLTGKLDFANSEHEIKRQCHVVAIDYQLPIELKHIYHV